MCEEKFLDLINEIREASFDTLVKKNSGYATEDRLHNFREGAKVTGLTAAQTAWGYLTKHLVALRDKIERDDFNNRDDFKEKVQDSINYLCLIWAIGNEIEQEPTVDAVPVVRCFECKKGLIDDKFLPYQYYCRAGFGWKNWDFCCAYGEREEGAE